MKIRLDFVTNSSSTAYICLISGEVVAQGQNEDFDFEDIGFCECIKGHTFSDKYVLGDLEFLPKEKILKLLEEEKERRQGVKWYTEEDVADVQKDISGLSNDNSMDIVKKYDLLDRYKLPESYCPICQLTYIQERYILRYITKYCEDFKQLNEFDETIKYITDKIRERYNSFDEMKEDLK